MACVEAHHAAQAALPRRALGPMPTLPQGAPDPVVDQDGGGGWCTATDIAAIGSVEIGLHGPRLLDAVTGNAHLPLCRNADETQPDEAALRAATAVIAPTMPVSYPVRSAVFAQP